MSKIIYLHPEEVRFTQDTISDRFPNGEKVVSFIRVFCGNKNKSENKEPETIKITEYNGNYFTLNNRTLYWIRHGNYEKIKCIFVPFRECQKEFENKFTTRNWGVQTRIREEKAISNIDTGRICLQSLPCQHDCIITYLDGTDRSVRLSAKEILRLMIDNQLKIDTHFLQYMSTSRASYYEKDFISSDFKVMGSKTFTFNDESENKPSENETNKGNGEKIILVFIIGIVCLLGYFLSCI